MDTRTAEDQGEHASKLSFEEEFDRAYACYQVVSSDLIDPSMGNDFNYQGGRVAVYFTNKNEFGGKLRMIGRCEFDSGGNIVKSTRSIVTGAAPYN